MTQTQQPVINDNQSNTTGATEDQSASRILFDFVWSQQTNENNTENANSTLTPLAPESLDQNLFPPGMSYFAAGANNQFIIGMRNGEGQTGDRQYVFMNNRGETVLGIDYQRTEQGETFILRDNNSQPLSYGTRHVTETNESGRPVSGTFWTHFPNSGRDQSTEDYQFVELNNGMLTDFRGRYTVPDLDEDGNPQYDEEGNLKTIQRDMRCQFADGQLVGMQYRDSNGGEDDWIEAPPEVRNAVLETAQLLGLDINADHLFGNDNGETQFVSLEGDGDGAGDGTEPAGQNQGQGQIQYFPINPYIVGHVEGGQAAQIGMPGEQPVGGSGVPVFQQTAGGPGVGGPGVGAPGVGAPGVGGPGFDGPAGPAGPGGPLGFGGPGVGGPADVQFIPAPFGGTPMPLDSGPPGTLREGDILEPGHSPVMRDFPSLPDQGNPITSGVFQHNGFDLNTAAGRLGFARSLGLLGGHIRPGPLVNGGTYDHHAINNHLAMRFLQAGTEEERRQVLHELQRQVTENDRGERPTNESAREVLRQATLVHNALRYMEANANGDTQGRFRALVDIAAQSLNRGDVTAYQAEEFLQRCPGSTPQLRESVRQQVRADAFGEFVRTGTQESFQRFCAANGFPGGTREWATISADVNNLRAGLTAGNVQQVQDALASIQGQANLTDAQGQQVRDLIDNPQALAISLSQLDPASPTTTAFLDSLDRGGQAGRDLAQAIRAGGLQGIQNALAAQGGIDAVDRALETDAQRNPAAVALRNQILDALPPGMNITSIEQLRTALGGANAMKLMQAIAPVADRAHQRWEQVQWAESQNQVRLVNEALQPGSEAGALPQALRNLHAQVAGNPQVQLVANRILAAIPENQREGITTLQDLATVLSTGPQGRRDAITAALRQAVGVMSQERAQLGQLPLNTPETVNSFLPGMTPEAILAATRQARTENAAVVQTFTNDAAIFLNPRATQQERDEALTRLRRTFDDNFGRGIRNDHMTALTNITAINHLDTLMTTQNPQDAARAIELLNRLANDGNFTAGTIRNALGGGSPSAGHQAMVDLVARLRHPVDGAQALTQLSEIFPTLPDVDGLRRQVHTDLVIGNLQMSTLRVTDFITAREALAPLMSHSDSARQWSQWVTAAEQVARLSEAGGSDRTRRGPQSDVAPPVNVEAAREAFNRLLTMARGGNEDARNQLMGIVIGGTERDSAAHWLQRYSGNDGRPVLPADLTGLPEDVQRELRLEAVRYFCNSDISLSESEAAGLGMMLARAHHLSQTPLAGRAQTDNQQTLEFISAALDRNVRHESGGPTVEGLFQALITQPDGAEILGRHIVHGAHHPNFNTYFQGVTRLAAGGEGTLPQTRRAAIDILSGVVNGAGSTGQDSLRDTARLTLEALSRDPATRTIIMDSLMASYRDYHGDRHSLLQTLGNVAARGETIPPAVMQVLREGFRDSLESIASPQEHASAVQGMLAVSRHWTVDDARLLTTRITPQVSDALMTFLPNIAQGRNTDQQNEIGRAIVQGLSDHVLRSQPEVGPPAPESPMPERLESMRLIGAYARFGSEEVTSRIGRAGSDILASIPPGEVRDQAHLAISRALLQQMRHNASWSGPGAEFFNREGWPRSLNADVQATLRAYIEGRPPSDFRSLHMISQLIGDVGRQATPAVVLMQMGVQLDRLPPERQRELLTQLERAQTNAGGAQQLIDILCNATAFNALPPNLRNRLISGAAADAPPPGNVNPLDVIRLLSESRDAFTTAHPYLNGNLRDRITALRDADINSLLREGESAAWLHAWLVGNRTGDSREQRRDPEMDAALGEFRRVTQEGQQTPWWMVFHPGIYCIERFRSGGYQDQYNRRQERTITDVQNLIVRRNSEGPTVSNIQGFDVALQSHQLAVLMSQLRVAEADTLSLEMLRQHGISVLMQATPPRVEGLPTPLPPVLHHINGQLPQIGQPQLQGDRGAWGRWNRQGFTDFSVMPMYNPGLPTVEELTTRAQQLRAAGRTTEAVQVEQLRDQITANTITGDARRDALDGTRRRMNSEDALLALRGLHRVVDDQGRENPQAAALRSFLRQEALRQLDLHPTAQNLNRAAGEINQLLPVLQTMFQEGMAHDRSPGLVNYLRGNGEDPPVGLVPRLEQAVRQIQEMRPQIEELRRQWEQALPGITDPEARRELQSRIAALSAALEAFSPGGQSATLIADIAREVNGPSFNETTFGRWFRDKAVLVGATLVAAALIVATVGAAAPLIVTAATIALATLVIAEGYGEIRYRMGDVNASGRSMLMQAVDGDRVYNPRTGGFYTPTGFNSSNIFDQNSVFGNYSVRFGRDTALNMAFGVGGQYAGNVFRSLSGTLPTGATTASTLFGRQALGNAGRTIFFRPPGVTGALFRPQGIQGTVGSRFLRELGNQTAFTLSTQQGGDLILSVAGIPRTITDPDGTVRPNPWAEVVHHGVAILAMIGHAGISHSIQRHGLRGTERILERETGCPNTRVRIIPGEHGNPMVVRYTNTVTGQVHEVPMPRPAAPGTAPVATETPTTTTTGTPRPTEVLRPTETPVETVRPHEAATTRTPLPETVAATLRTHGLATEPVLTTLEHLQPAARENFTRMTETHQRALADALHRGLITPEQVRVALSNGTLSESALAVLQHHTSGRINEQTLREFFTASEAAQVSLNRFMNDSHINIEQMQRLSELARTNPEAFNALARIHTRNLGHEGTPTEVNARRAADRSLVIELLAVPNAARREALIQAAGEGRISNIENLHQVLRMLDGPPAMRDLANRILAQAHEPGCNYDAIFNAFRNPRLTENGIPELLTQALQNGTLSTSALSRTLSLSGTNGPAARDVLIGMLRNNVLTLPSMDRISNLTPEQIIRIGDAHSQGIVTTEMLRQALTLPRGHAGDIFQVLDHQLSLGAAARMPRERLNELLRDAHLAARARQELPVTETTPLTPLADIHGRPTWTQEQLNQAVERLGNTPQARTEVLELIRAGVPARVIQELTPTQIRAQGGPLELARAVNQLRRQISDGTQPEHLTREQWQRVCQSIETMLRGEGLNGDTTFGNAAQNARQFQSNLEAVHRMLEFMRQNHTTPEGQRRARAFAEILATGEGLAVQQLPLGRLSDTAAATALPIQHLERYIELLREANIRAPRPDAPPQEQLAWQRMQEVLRTLRTADGELADWTLITPSGEGGQLEPFFFNLRTGAIRPADIVERPSGPGDPLRPYEFVLEGEHSFANNGVGGRTGYLREFLARPNGALTTTTGSIRELSAQRHDLSRRVQDLIDANPASITDPVLRQLVTELQAARADRDALMWSSEGHGRNVTRFGGHMRTTYELMAEYTNLLRECYANNANLRSHTEAGIQRLRALREQLSTILGPEGSPSATSLRGAEQALTAARGQHETWLRDQMTAAGLTPPPANQPLTNHHRNALAAARPALAQEINVRFEMYNTLSQMTGVGRNSANSVNWEAMTNHLRTIHNQMGDAITAFERFQNGEISATQLADAVRPMRNAINATNLGIRGNSSISNVLNELAQPGGIIDRTRWFPRDYHESPIGDRENTRWTNYINHSRRIAAARDAISAYLVQQRMQDLANASPTGMTRINVTRDASNNPTHVEWIGPIQPNGQPARVNAPAGGTGPALTEPIHMRIMQSNGESYTVTIPAGYVPRGNVNGEGLTFEPPAGWAGRQLHYRIMGPSAPGAQYPYPNGYVRVGEVVINPATGQPHTMEVTTGSGATVRVPVLNMLRADGRPIFGLDPAGAARLGINPGEWYISPVEGQPASHFQVFHISEAPTQAAIAARTSSTPSLSTAQLGTLARLQALENNRPGLPQRPFQQRTHAHIVPSVTTPAPTTTGGPAGPKGPKSP